MTLSNSAEEASPVSLKTKFFAKKCIDKFISWLATTHLSMWWIPGDSQMRRCLVPEHVAS